MARALAAGGVGAHAVRVTARLARAAVRSVVREGITASLVRSHSAPVAVTDRRAGRRCGARSAGVAHAVRSWAKAFSCGRGAPPWVYRGHL